MDCLDELPPFFAQQASRCAELGIDVAQFEVSHAAMRVRTWRDYVRLRDGLEALADGNRENVWNGRPISKVLLNVPIPLASGAEVRLIELIPPFHQRVYRMGWEHIGFVVGEEVDGFARRHRASLTGQQFQSPACEPYYVMFGDYTHVKFYRHSLADVCVLEGGSLEGFEHVDWAPDDPLAGPYEVA
jgi:predicted metalloenzyme YecM